MAGIKRTEVPSCAMMTAKARQSAAARPVKRASRMAAWDGVLPTVLSEAHDGRIILMHDLSAHSVTCALQAIDRLMAQGYEFCTVSQLAQLRGTALAPGEVYTGFPPKDS